MPLNTMYPDDELRNRSSRHCAGLTHAHGTNQLSVVQLSSQLQLQACGHSTPHLETWSPSSPGRPHRLSTSATNCGWGSSLQPLEVGVRWKLPSHLTECCSIGVDFISLVAETLGGLAKDTISTVRVIGKVLGQRVSPSDPSTSTKHLFGRLDIALWRGHACLWFHRYPSVPPSLDGLI